MLQTMRKFARGWISSIFLGGLALSFALWGIADIFRGGSSTTVFTVGSSEASLPEFQREYHNALRNNQITAPTPEQSRALAQSVLDRMMLRQALDNLTASLGVTASDARVRQDIQSSPVFA
ncbi:MAG: SurA N-terminal domain-containing protein, partial [Alphaproteobacteria bacterium]|nr:SurA N-terminal domain-containing protein [Alphaproteobacteria bacterium]